jgi:multiple sugar transport system substrate-binding protein
MNSTKKADYAEDFDYSEITTYEEYLAAYSEMNKKIYMEMLSGEGPDVIYGTQGMSFSLYESKGLLVDLYTLMENDDSFVKEDYIQSILALSETNGKLYQMPTSFMLQGFAGAKSVIGDRTGWTVDEFNEMVNSLPSGVLPLANHTQEELLSASLNASMEAFVDVETGKVNFDSEEFRQLLDLAKTYGTVDTGEEPGYENNVDEWTLVQNGELALMTCMISDPFSYDQMKTVFGEDVSIVGYPSSTKSGPMCESISSFSISSESSVQDGAWSFVKMFFTEDYQKKVINSGWGIPVMTTVFEEQIDRAINPPDNNGGNPIVFDSGYFGNEPMSEASAQEYRDLINSLNTLMDSDQQILSIIMEEVPAYFNGQKNDKAVSELIQNRVQTLVNERQ